MKLMQILKEMSDVTRGSKYPTLKIDQVGTFYVCEYPRDKGSSALDGVFEVDVFGFANQIRGGLAEKEVYGLFKKQADAELAFERLKSSGKFKSK